MAGKNDPHGTGSPFDNELAKSVSDSAQRIWLAGLGAFERAREEGPRVFDALVEQGQQMNDKARDAAEQALRQVRESANSAGGTFGRLEQAIEERIARTLNRMGVITRAEVADLSAQMGQLADEMHGLMRQSRAAASKAQGSGKRRAKAAEGRAGKKKRVKRSAKPAKRRAKRR